MWHRNRAVPDTRRMETSDGKNHKDGDKVRIGRKDRGLSIIMKYLKLHDISVQHSRNIHS